MITDVKRKLRVENFGVVLRLITLTVCLCMTGVSVFAGTFYEGNIEYRSEGKNAVVIGYIGIDKNIVIPTTVYDKYYTVTQIDPQAFKNNLYMESISIPLSVTTIGDEAFYGCSKLKSITISENVTKLGSTRLFDSCHDLESVTIRCKLKEMGEYFFGNCESLTSITIPETVTTIGKRAFYNCTSLTSIKIPDAVESIGNEAFFMCSALESIEIGKSVNKIGRSAFYGSGLKSLYFNAPYCQPCEDGYSWGFSESLENIILGEDLKSIPEKAFTRTGVRSIVIPDWITSIGSKAFSECSNLETVTIGESVTYIGGGAFYICNNLKEVRFNAENCTHCGIKSSMWLYHPDSLAFSSSVENVEIGPKVTRIPENAFPMCNIESLDIPSGVTDIGDYAFYLNRNMSSLNLGPTVKSIGNNAFGQVYAISSITIPASVEEIGRQAFDNCHMLEEVDFEAENCMKCGEGAFTNVRKVIIGPKVKNVPENTFQACSALREIDYRAESLRMNVNQWSTGAYPPRVTRIIIDKGVREINSYVFWGCSTIGEIKFNAENCIIVKSYPDDILWTGFIPYDNIGHIIIGENVTAVPDYLCHRSHVKKITVGSSVETLGKYAFSHCDKLEAIEFLGTPRSCGIAFGEYDKLESVNIVNAHDWATLSMIYSPFASNHAMLLVNGERVVNLGLNLPGQDIGNGFMGANIEKARIKARGVGYDAFYGSRLKSVCLDVETIGEYAFCGENLAEVYSLTAEPPVAHDNAFLTKCYSRGKLYVPVGSREKYKNSSSCWYQFENIIETDFAGIDENFKADNADECSGLQEIISQVGTDSDKVSIYTMGGVKVGHSLEGLTPGIYIVHGRGGAYKHIVK